VEHLDLAGLDPRLAEAQVLAICDVDNPLLGEQGAARAFGPQKGATLAMVARLEANLTHWAAVIERDLGRDVRAMVHGGAAGARAAGVPVVALAGGISDEVRTEAFELFDAIVPICPRPMDLEEAMGRAQTSLVEAAERVGRLLQIGARVPVAPRAT
jgi:glycerate kinase